MATHLWRMNRPGVIRLPFLSPEGEHVVAGLARDRRIVTYARVYDYADERDVVRIMDHWLTCPVLPLPAPLLRPAHDPAHHRRWAPGGMC